MPEEKKSKVEPCSDFVICPTSFKEMRGINKRLDAGGEKMATIMKEVRKNRKFDIAILAMGVISFITTIFLKG